MRIVNHKEMYKELVEYACLNCNVVSIAKRYYKYDETPRVIQVILKKMNITVEDIVFKYSEKYFNELYSKLCYDEEIFDKAYIKKFERCNGRKKSQKIRANDNQRRYYIKNSLEYIIYDYNVKMWLRKYKEKIILKREGYYGTEYYIKLNEALKKELHEKKTFFDWQFPDFVEGISFYKDERCLLKSSYGRWCYVDIYPENEKEYKYLKSIGIQFDEKKFEPISKLEAKYVNISELTKSKY